MLIVFLIDRLVESPREEAERRTYMMAQAADLKSPDAFVTHLADEVSIASGNEKGKTLTREQMKRSPFWDTLRHFDVHVAVWDFSRNHVKQINENTIEIGFMGKGEVRGGEQIPVYVRSTFTRQSDGSFKLSAMRTFDPLNHDAPLSIPGFP